MLRVVLLSIVVCWIMLFSATPTLAVDVDVVTEEKTNDSASSGDEEGDVPMIVTFVNEMPDAVSSHIIIIIRLLACTNIYHQTSVRALSIPIMISCTLTSFYTVY